MEKGLREFKKVIHNNKAEYEGREIMKKFDCIIEPDAAFWAYWYPLQNTIRGIVVNMVLTGVVAHGAYRYYYDEISAGFFLSLVAWSTQIAASLWEIAQLEHQFNHVTPSILKLKAGFDLPVGIDRSPNGIILPPDSPFELEFRDVSFWFEGGKDKDGNVLPRQPILEGLSFKIPRGTKVALIAPSGMGKSTAISLAMGDKDPNSGAIYIDGHRLQDLDRGSVLDCIGFVPQEAEIFDGTVFSNVCYGLRDPKSGSREKVEHFAKKCKMDFLRNGLDTIVGTNGDKLSGGQKQRVGIAMAMMKEPKIYIIDEGTNSLDPTSKKEVQGSLDEMMAGDKSGLTVTHDLNAVRHTCHRFLFLDKAEEGRGSSIVAEAGSLEELAEKNATFRQFALDQGIVL
ncbi:MAG: ABC transporter ATP-binding protein [Patescibacteria group bacterium]